MIVLGIETSCDETALSIIESETGSEIAVLADKTLSQAELHEQYGGVFPNMAKREHAKNLIPLLETVLKAAGFLKSKIKEGSVIPAKAGIQSGSPPSRGRHQNVDLQLTTLLEREPEMLEAFLKFIPTAEKPPIDAIAVTAGPGLEPCLWTGLNLAKALSFVWNIPAVPVNHMEGHIFSALLSRKNEVRSSKFEVSKSEPTSYQLKTIIFPALSLLISGGHTELVLVKDWFSYEIIGQTRDDAVGEAFDKVARLLGLPYPGGPQISALAEQARKATLGSTSRTERRLNLKLPRPMLHSPDFDFSFSGIKTSVLYLIKKIAETQSSPIPPFLKEVSPTFSEKRGTEDLNNTLSPSSKGDKSLPIEDSGTPFKKGRILTSEFKAEIALEFENAVTEVLVAKTKKALEHYGAQMLLLGGGVAANTHIRKECERLAGEENIPLFVPEKNLTTDNALMIAVAGLLRFQKKGGLKQDELKARGNLRLGEEI